MTDTNISSTIAYKNAAITRTEVKRESDRRILHYSLNTCCSTCSKSTKVPTEETGFDLTTDEPVELDTLTLSSFCLISQYEVIYRTQRGHIESITGSAETS